MIPQLKNNPLVTVAMVTYNSSKYVRVAIESVLASTYENFELIISDDCSTDNTWEIINEYNDSRIRKYRNEENINEYPNRNRCIDLAKGKYFIFIDGDDVILPHGLETYVRYLESYEEAAFVVEKGYFNNIIFPVVLEANELFELELTAKSLLTSSFSSNFFKTEILRREGKLKTNYRTGDDEVRIRLALKYPVLFIAGWLTWPRETPGQASSRLNNGEGLIESIDYIKMIINKNLNNDINVKAYHKVDLCKKQLLKEFIKAVISRDYLKVKIIYRSCKVDFSLKSIFQLFTNNSKEEGRINYTPEAPLNRFLEHE